jgi:hypothetical protein
MPFGVSTVNQSSAYTPVRDDLSLPVPFAFEYHGRCLGGIFIARIQVFIKRCAGRAEGNDFRQILFECGADDVVFHILLRYQSEGIDWNGSLRLPINEDIFNNVSLIGNDIEYLHFI